MNGYPVVCGWPGCKGAKMLRWLESYRHEARRYRAARPRHCHRKGSCRACFENAPTSTVLSVGTVKLSTVVTDECRADAWKTPRHLLEHGYNANAKACPAARRTCASIPTTPTPPTVAHETMHTRMEECPEPESRHSNPSHPYKGNGKTEHLRLISKSGRKYLNQIV